MSKVIDQPTLEKARKVNPHIEKWKRMSTLERTIQLLTKKKERREAQIKKLRKELKEINGALKALGKVSQDNEEDDG